MNSFDVIWIGLIPLRFARSLLKPFLKMIIYSTYPRREDFWGMKDLKSLYRLRSSIFNKSEEVHRDQALYDVLGLVYLGKSLSQGGSDKPDQGTCGGIAMGRADARCQLNFASKCSTNCTKRCC